MLQWSVQAVTLAAGILQRTVFRSNTVCDSSLAWQDDALYFPAHTGLPFPEPTCFGTRLNGLASLANISSRQAVLCYQTRIRQVDTFLHAISDQNPDALLQADRMDEELRKSHRRSPLHGIPVCLKDNMATRDKMQTTGGTLALLGSRVPRDAHLVKRLRDAGAVILAKTAMEELASMRSLTIPYSSGFSTRSGQVRSPFNLSSAVGGSSSGAGAAVAAGLCPIAFGTETDGTRKT
jgi:amidase